MLESPNGAFCTTLAERAPRVFVGALVNATATAAAVQAALADGGASLVLSGHTHWGQLAVPLVATRFNLARIGYRHHAGLYRRGSAHLHVSPGLGTTGTPVRLGVPPELTEITLVRPGQRRDTSASTG